MHLLAIKLTASRHLTPDKMFILNEVERLLKQLANFWPQKSARKKRQQNSEYAEGVSSND